jgi:hypothetical protein
MNSLTLLIAGVCLYTWGIGVDIRWYTPLRVVVASVVCVLAGIGLFALGTLEALLS